MTKREEKILETLYLWWKDGKVPAVLELSAHHKLTPQEWESVRNSLTAHGYLEEMKDNEELKLTDLGKVRAAESLVRHQHLTEFLQITCGVGEEKAQENACRMEHVIDGEIMEGVREFLKYGDTCDRMVRNLNLHSMYEKGSYTFYMGIYCMEQRYPRILAEEFYHFSEGIGLEVGKEHSSFYLREKKISPVNLWYKEKSRWKKAERTEQGFRIPAEIFTFTISSRIPVTEGDGVIAFSMGDSLPEEENCRELNVHIW